MTQDEFNTMFAKAVGAVQFRTQDEATGSLTSGPHTLSAWANVFRLAAEQIKAHERNHPSGGSSPQKVRFPGATVSVPPIDMPVEDA